MKRMFTKALNLFSVLLLLVAIGFSFFTVTQPNMVSAAWDGTVATSFNSGSGTESSPYVISTEKQLGYFMAQLASGVTYEGQYVQLGKSLNMTGNIWDTSHYTAFGGVFDGQGYTITADCPFMTVIGTTGIVQGLNYNTNHIQLGRALICDTNNGIIRSCTAYGDVYATSGSPVYGGMICTKNTGTVENCGAIGSLYASGDDTSAYAAMVPQNSGTVTGCYSAITVGALGTGKYSDEEWCPVSHRGYCVNSFYDADLYTKSAHCGEGLTTAQLQSDAFLTSLQGTSVTGTRWVKGSHGYPELAHCSTSYAYVSGYQGNTEPIIYSTSSKTIILRSSSTSEYIFYTLDGSDPVTSSTRTYTKSGSVLSGSGDMVLTMVPYYDGTYGTVTRQTFINLQGSGTEANPYKITTKRQLDAIRMLPDKAFVLKNDLAFTDADFTLGGIAAGGWTPIPNFSGKLDGNGYAIIGLRGNHGGLFDTVETGATVTSLRLLDHKLCSPGDFGAIAEDNFGTITRCYVKSAFTLSNAPSGQEPNSGFPYIGGIVSFNRGTVSYCRNDGLTVGLGVARYGQVYMGGITGSNQGTLESCVNFGGILLRNNAHADNGYFGGITGTGDVYEANCRSRCNMSLQNSFDYSVVCTAMSGEDPYLASVASLCIADPFTVSWSIPGAYSTPTTNKYAISGIARDSYTLQDWAIPESYPKLDFSSDWMFTQEGPMPQGVMDENGHCLRSSAYIAPSCTKTGSVTLYCELCSHVETQTLDKIPHNYSAYVSDSNATCLEDGTKTKTCSGCGLKDTVTDEGSALGHTYENHAADGNATCTEDGTKTGKCIRCDETETLPDTGSALGHSFTGYVSNGDAACTVDGTETAKCDRCEVTDTRTDEGTALGHSFTIYTSNGDAQCEVDGTKTAKCDRCEVTDTVTEEDTMLGHSFTDYVSDENAGCYTDGTETAKCDRCDVTDTRTEEGTAGHLFTNYVSNNNATCLYPGTMTAKCDRCTVKDTKVELGSQKGHSFTNYVSNGDADCLNDGTKTAKCDRCTVKDTLADEGSALGHSFTDYVSDGNVTCTEDGTQTAKCDRCEVTDTVVLEALGHDMGQWFTVTEASCTASGLEQSDCARCAHSETRIIPILPHSFEAAVTEPTCTEQGYTTYTCHCGESYVSDRMPSLGHSFTKYVSDGNATCTADGTQTAKCDRCEETDTIQLKALGHSYTNYTSIGNATCTADGLKIATCDRCPEMDFAVDEGSMLGHSFTDYVSNGDATCVGNGTETANCDRCDETETREEEDSALGHDLSVWYTVTEATCTEEGLEQSDCTRCGHSETMPIPATGHSYTEEVIEPTCTEGGSTVHTCHCGDSYEDGYTEMLGHSFTKYVSNENAACTKNGTETAKCDRCQETDTREEADSALGHSFGDWIRDEDAGTETSTCERCGETVDRPITEYSGICGDDLRWTFNTVTGELRISGKGDMYDYDDNDVDAPWLKHEAGITSLILEEGITHIGSQAFDIWYDFTEITLPESLTSIGRFAFSHSQQLTRINIPKNLVSIGSPLFSGCENLEEFLVDPENPCYSSADGVLYNKDQTALLSYPDNHGEEFVIPGNVTAIGEYAFYYADRLHHVTIPDGVTMIGKNAFDWSSIEEIVLPESLTRIESYTFASCTSLRSISIPDSVTSIGSTAFLQCAIEEIRLPETITYIGDSAFTYCESLKSIVIPEGITTINYSTFRNCYSLESITIPQSVAAIHNNAFEGCEALTNVYYGGTEEMKELLFIGTENEALVNANWVCRVCEHRFGDWETVTEATCLDAGEEVRKCDDCIATERRVIPAAGHVYESVVTEPTCLEQGYTTHTCHCGYSYQSSFTAKLGHSFTDYVSNGDATCVLNGRETAKCDRCDVTDIRIDRDSALGHDMGQWYTVTEATCVLTGTQQSDCSRCDHFETFSIPALGHAEGTAVRENEQAPTCTEEGRYDLAVYCPICGIETERNTHTVPANGHSHTSVVTEPTCLEQGYTTYTCHCGDSYRDDYTDALDHDYEHYVADPTCTGQGYTTHVCIRCHYIAGVSDYTDALGHSFTQYVSNGGASCTEDGTETAKCDRCEETHTRKEADSALGHDMGQWYTVSEATCTENGQERRLCTRCAYHETAVIPATGHRYDSQVTEPGCTEGGYTTHTCHCGDSYVDSYTNALGHSFGIYVSNGDAGCTENGTETAKCDRCDVTDTRIDGDSALGHDMGKRYTVTEATCVLTGTQQSDCSRCDHFETFRIPALGHAEGAAVRENEQAPTCTEEGRYDLAVYCPICGIGTERNTYTVPATGHSHTSAVTEPTCLEQGYTTYTCHCGDSYKGDYTDALDHDYIEVFVDPTCTNQGYTLITCSRCDLVGMSDHTDPLGHSFTQYVSNGDASCTKDGTETAKCDRCEETHTRKEADSALGHDMGQWYTVSEATCTENGQERRLCTRCAYHETAVIPATGHRYDSQVTEPGCTEGGYTTHTCHCGDSYVDSYTDALGHCFGIYVSDENATCTEDGTKTALCDRCGATDTVVDEGSVQGHYLADSWQVVIAPTCITEGLETATCSVCGVYQESHEIPFTGHSYEAIVTAPTCQAGGYTTHTCHCGDSYVDSYTNALGHSFGEWYVVEDATYTEPGREQRDCEVCGCSEVNLIPVLQTQLPEVSGSVDKATGKPVITWTYVEKATGYVLWRSVEPEGPYVNEAEFTDGNRYVDEFAQAGVTYFYSVTPVFDDFYVSEGNTVSILCRLASPELNVSRNEDTGKPKLSWNAVEGAEKYRIYRSTTETGGFEYLKSTQTVTSYTDTAAEVGTTYFYKVKAYHANTQANSEWSNTVRFSCGLEAPVVSISGNAASGKPIVKWESVEGAAKYRVYRSLKKTSGFELVYTGITARSYTDKTAEAGTNYYYKVKAYLADGKTGSPWSETVNRVCDLAAPAVSITGNSATGKPTVKWETVEGAVKYRVYRSESKSSGYELVYTGITARSYTDKTAEAGINYYYKVKAIHEKSSANSAYSGIVNRVCDLPKPVVEISLTAGGNPRLVWEAIEGAVKYRVYRCDTRDGQFELVKTTVTATSFTDKEAASGQVWFYKVIALHETSSANSAYSTIVSVTAE